MISWKSVLKGERGRIAGNAIWLLAERGVTLACQLVVSIALARYLGPSEFGVYSLALALATFALTFSSLGLNHTLTREVVVAPAAAPSILATAIELRFIGAVVGAVSVVVVARVVYPQLETLGAMALALSVGILARSLDGLEFYFHARLRGRTLVTTRSVAAVTSALAVLGAIRLGAGPETFAVIKSAEFSLAAILLLAAFHFGSDSPGFAMPTLAHARSLLTKSWPLMLSSVGAIIYLKIDQAMLAAMAGPDAVGIYSVAAQLSEVWYFVPVAIATSAFPALLQARMTSTASYEVRLQRLYDLVAVLGLFSAAVISWLSPWLIGLLYGPQFTGAAAVLSLHVWASVFVFMRAVLSKWLIAEELYLFSLVTHGAGALANVALNYVLIPSHGPVGAAAATVISYSVASYGALFFHPKTRPAGWMMTRALVAPIRYLFRSCSSRR